MSMVVPAARGRKLIILICLLPTLAYGTMPDCPPPKTGAPLEPSQIAALDVPHALPKSIDEYNHILDDTLQSLDKLRGKDGLVQDRGHVISGDDQHAAKIKITKVETSPSNIGLDLLTQASVALGKAGKDPTKMKDAFDTMSSIISTLSDDSFEKYHPLLPNGQPDTKHMLLYSWYSTDDSKPTLKNVSSVDNIHLALALWSVAKNFPGQPVAEKAQALFDKMDFSSFYDAKSGLVGGNLTYHKDTGKWTRDTFNYQYFGAETRSIYALGYALGLFRTVPTDSLVSRAVASLQMELYPTKKGNILRTWDGGAFQELLPEDLINEDAYSSRLAESASALAPFMRAKAKKVLGTLVPASFSASQIGENDYAAMAGLPELVATAHTDICDPAKRDIWTKSFTPHAAIMAATVNAQNADSFAGIFSGLQNYSSGNGKSVDKLYNPGIGFSDGLIVDRNDPNYGKVVPGVLALDQLFIAGGIMRINDPHSSGLSADTLESDPVVRHSLHEFYQAVDQKLEQTRPSAAPVSCPGQANPPKEGFFKKAFGL
jgi:hypothetical protein